MVGYGNANNESSNFGEIFNAKKTNTGGTKNHKNAATVFSAQKILQSILVTNTAAIGELKTQMPSINPIGIANGAISI